MAILNQLRTAVTPTAPITTDNGATSSGYQWGIVKVPLGAPQFFVYNIALILIYALSIVAVVTLIYAGVRYITAGGDSEKAESAKKIIIGSVIGLILIIASYLIFNSAVSALTPETQGGVPYEQVLPQQYKPGP